MKAPVSHHAPVAVGSTYSRFADAVSIGGVAEWATSQVERHGAQGVTVTRWGRKRVYGITSCVLASLYHQDEFWKCWCGFQLLRLETQLYSWYSRCYNRGRIGPNLTWPVGSCQGWVGYRTMWLWHIVMLVRYFTHLPLTWWVNGFLCELYL